MNLNETIHGFARLDFQGILLNGEFVEKEGLSKVFIGADASIVPLFSNQMNSRKVISQVKIQSLQNYVKGGGKLS